MWEEADLSACGQQAARPWTPTHGDGWEDVSTPDEALDTETFGSDCDTSECRLTPTVECEVDVASPS